MVNLSMDLDTSENWAYDAAENANLTFVDELKIYLKTFKLEKNRKLVLESVQKICMFESLIRQTPHELARRRHHVLASVSVCQSVVQSAAAHIHGGEEETFGGSGAKKGEAYNIPNESG